MSEKRSIVIEEYLLLLYQLRGAGERLKAVTLPLQQEEQQVTLPFHVADKIHVVQVED